MITTEAATQTIRLLKDAGENKLAAAFRLLVRCQEIIDEEAEKKHVAAVNASDEQGGGLWDE